VKFFPKKVRVPQNSCLLGSHLGYCPKAKYIPHDGENLGLMNVLDMLEAYILVFIKVLAILVVGCNIQSLNFKGINMALCVYVILQSCEIVLQTKRQNSNLKPC